MAYSTQTWQDGDSSYPLSASRMTHIEDGLAGLDSGKADTSAIPTQAGDVGAVPTSRTVNGHALSGNISLGASDVGAATAAQGSLAGSAVQPGDLATVATSGSAGDLTGTLALGRMPWGSGSGMVMFSAHNGSSWPSRPVSSGGMCIYLAADSGTSSPTDFVAGSDVLLIPQSS